MNRLELDTLPLEELDGLALEYQRDYGTASWLLDISEFTNSSFLRRGNCLVYNIVYKQLKICI